jgi:hypothetical protein
MVATDFGNPRWTSKRRGIIATDRPALALPCIEARRTFGDLSNGRLGRTVVEGFRVDETRVELLLRCAVGDAPRADRVVQVFASIDRSCVNVASSLTATTALGVRDGDATCGYRIRVISKLVVSWRLV